MHSIVVPVYRNEATLRELLWQIAALGGELAEPLEVVCVVDGSPDNSYALLKIELPKMPFRSQVLCLSRNFGSFARFAPGSRRRGRLHRVSGGGPPATGFVGQDLFELLTGGADVAIGQRVTSADPYSPGRRRGSSGDCIAASSSTMCVRRRRRVRLHAPGARYPGRAARSQ